jgi:ribonuclease HI
MFSQEEANLILSFPLSGTRQDDVLVWRGTAKGVFSVRSAYYMQKEVEERSKAENSHGGRLSVVWGKIWKFPIPNVEKNFLWSACHEILPTRANLHKCKVVENPMCPLCEREDETEAHILWNCPSAADVWSAGMRIFQKSSFHNQQFLQIVEEMVERCTNEEIKQFSGISRRLWLRRNEVVYGGNFANPTAIVQVTVEAIAAFKAAQGSGYSSSGMVRVNQWRAPPVGWLTANWDAAINNKEGRWGLGMILRDHTGRMIAAKCSARLGCLNPAAAEAIAALEAMVLCCRLGYDRIQFEGNAKLVVEAITTIEPDWSTKGHIIDAMEEQARSFHQWQISHISREANQIAHVLAKMGSTRGLENEWFSEPPHCIQDILAAEQCVTIN